MISIIISSKNPFFFNNISENIELTIGTPFEIIKIENNAKYSLAEAYNIGESRAKYEYLCFVHDDVNFKTNEWGKILMSTMESDEKIGLIGVAGNKFKSSYPSAIGQSEEIRKKFMRGHIYQMSKGYCNFDNSKIPKLVEEVVCIDGVFMFTKKSIFKHCYFDEKMLTHFHGYDLDLSLQIYFSGYRVLVHREVLIEHLSDGNYSFQNTIANRRVNKKWRKKLPTATKDLSLTNLELYFLDLKNWAYFIRKALLRKLKIIIK